MFEIVEKEPSGTVIKVIGVGGAGGNAVDHMIREGVKGVHFITANTDAQALNRCLASHKVQLGSTGLAKPEPMRDDAGWVGCRLAELLPLPLRDKQRLLEVGDPSERLRLLHQLLKPETGQ